MGIDVPHALVVLAETGGQHQVRSKVIHARNLIGEGHPVRDALRESMPQELDTSTHRSMRWASIARAQSFDESVFLEKMHAFVASASPQVRIRWGGRYR